MNEIGWFDHIKLIGKIIIGLATVATAIGTIWKAFVWLYRWYIVPTVAYRLIDSTSYSLSDGGHQYRADYGIIVKTKFKKNEQNIKEQGIKIILRPKVGLPSDFSVRILPFISRIGFDHLDIKTEPNDLEGCKEITFKIPENILYRVVIEFDIGYGGTALTDNYVLGIEATCAKVKCKKYQLPTL